jgi:Mce-associated membrane protein
LSYQPDDVDQKLGAARQLLTGQFLDAYTSLINDLVIPSAKQQRIVSSAAVPAVATASASAKHVVALVFVNQTITIGNGAPTTSASSVRVTLDRVGDHWLISSFEPV